MRTTLRLLLLAAVVIGASSWAAVGQEGAANQDGPGWAYRSAMPESPEWLDTILHWTARLTEMVGVGIIVLAAVAATVSFVSQIRQSGLLGENYHQYRANLGRGILLGLEFLVAADIIGTVAVAPTFYNLGVLGLIVLIRTFLSFSLEVEIEGRWPWQRSPRPGAAPDRSRQEAKEPHAQV